MRLQRGAAGRTQRGAAEEMKRIARRGDGEIALAARGGRFSSDRRPAAGARGVIAAE